MKRNASDKLYPYAEVAKEFKAHELVPKYIIGDIDDPSDDIIAINHRWMKGTDYRIVEFGVAYGPDSSPKTDNDKWIVVTDYNRDVLDTHMTDYDAMAGEFEGAKSMLEILKKVKPITWAQFDANNQKARAKNADLHKFSSAYKNMK